MGGYDCGGTVADCQCRCEEKGVQRTLVNVGADPGTRLPQIGAGNGEIARAHQFGGVEQIPFAIGHEFQMQIQREGNQEDVEHKADQSDWRDPSIDQGTDALSVNGISPLADMMRPA